MGSVDSRGLFRRTPTLVFLPPRITSSGAAIVSGSLTADAIVRVNVSGSFTANAWKFNAWDWVAPPANGVAMGVSPTLTLISPDPSNDDSAFLNTIYPAWFQIQLDTASTFNTANLKTYRMGDGQGTWEYFNGSIWVAMPSTGLSSSFRGNQVRFTVPIILSSGTWFRRFRWQIHA